MLRPSNSQIIDLKDQSFAVDVQTKPPLIQLIQQWRLADVKRFHLATQIPVQTIERIIRGDNNLLPFGKILKIAVDLGFVDLKAKNLWTMPVVRQIKEAWLEESKSLFRPTPLAALTAAIDLYELVCEEGNFNSTISAMNRLGIKRAVQVQLAKFEFVPLKDIKDSVQLIENKLGLSIANDLKLSQWDGICSKQREISFRYKIGKSLSMRPESNLQLTEFLGPIENVSVALVSRIKKGEILSPQMSFAVISALTCHSIDEFRANMKEAAKYFTRDQKRKGSYHPSPEGVFAKIFGISPNDLQNRITYWPRKTLDLGADNAKAVEEIVEKGRDKIKQVLIREETYLRNKIKILTNGPFKEYCEYLQKTGLIDSAVCGEKAINSIVTGESVPPIPYAKKMLLCEKLPPEIELQAMLDYNDTKEDLSPFQRFFDGSITRYHFTRPQFRSELEGSQKIAKSTFERFFKILKENIVFGEDRVEIILNNLPFDDQVSESIIRSLAKRFLERIAKGLPQDYPETIYDVYYYMDEELSEKFNQAYASLMSKFEPQSEELELEDSLIGDDLETSIKRAIYLRQYLSELEDNLGNKLSNTSPDYLWIARLFPGITRNELRTLSNDSDGEALDLDIEDQQDSSQTQSDQETFYAHEKQVDQDFLNSIYRDSIGY